jgi:hypothetical protein
MLCAAISKDRKILTKEQELCLSLWIVSGEIADPDAADWSSLLMLIEDMLVMIEVVEEAGLIALECDEMNIA